MSAELTWFRRPSPVDGDPWAGGTLNAAYQLLDRAVIEGNGDEPVLAGGLHAARLLELVAAFAGALHGFGATPGGRVLVDLPVDPEADPEADPQTVSDRQLDTVVALLGTARLGAVALTTEAELDPDLVTVMIEATLPDVVVTDGRASTAAGLAASRHRPAGVVSTALDPAQVTDPDGPVPWSLVMQAGRTEPAAAAELSAADPSLVIWPAAEASGVRIRNTVEQARRLLDAAGRTPLTPAELIRVLTG